jgi:sentrin-specific protease 1
VRRWTKPGKCPGGFFSYDLVVIPVHLGVHWCCGFIDFRRKTLELYDSMGFSEIAFFRVMRDYLESESQDKLGKPFDLTGWTNVKTNQCPQQDNGYDCGMFALKFADYRSRDKEFSFTQDDINYFRQRACWELRQGKWGL